METSRFSEAIQQFALVRDQEPGKPNGWYGMGLAYARQGQTSDAIDAFERALAIQPDFSYAKAELGYLMTDISERDQASQIAAELQTTASDLADTLSQYIFEKTPAEMVSVLPTGTFPKVLGPRTQVSALSSYLSSAGAQQTFSMIFRFNKPMDAESVENILNWSITRSTDTGRADGYNFGFTVPETEVNLQRFPSSVTYDPTLYSATVLFTISQNETADGTLDPSHIKFAFNGTDSGGLAISSEADEYTGFSGFA
jgi:tetratricopeptide (TPR) repeat protein